MAFSDFSLWFAFDLKSNRERDMSVVNTNFGCVSVALVEIKIAKISEQTTPSGPLVLRCGLENE